MNIASSQDYFAWLKTQTLPPIPPEDQRYNYRPELCANSPASRAMDREMAIARFWMRPMTEFLSEADSARRQQRETMTAAEREAECRSYGYGGGGGSQGRYQGD